MPLTPALQGLRLAS